MDNCLHTDAEAALLLKLDGDGLQLLLEVLDGAVGRVLGPGQGVEVALEILDLAGQLVLVEAGGLDGQLDLVEAAVNLLVLLLQPLLVRGHLDHSLVELLALVRILLDVDLELLDNLNKDKVNRNSQCIQLLQ